MLNQHEAYRRKAESFEKVARRLRDRTDPVGRKLFSFAERTARRFRHLAETLAALEEQRTRPCPKSTRFASSEFRFGPSRDNATIDLLTHDAFLLDRGAVSPIAVNTGERGRGARVHLRLQRAGYLGESDEDSCISWSSVRPGRRRLRANSDANSDLHGPGSGEKACRRRFEQLHEKVRVGRAKSVRCISCRKEARRCCQDQLHQEVRERCARQLMAAGY
jgi:hypothetical protein